MYGLNPDVTSRISRSAFTSMQGVALSLDAVPHDVQQALDASSVDQATLEQIAGPDRVIRGEELGELYDAILERNRGTRGGRLDLVAQVYRALQGSGVDVISGAAPVVGAGLRGEIRSAPRPD